MFNNRFETPRRERRKSGELRRCSWGAAEIYFARKLSQRRRASLAPHVGVPRELASSRIYRRSEKRRAAVERGACSLPRSICLALALALSLLFSDPSPFAKIAPCLCRMADCESGHVTKLATSDPINGANYRKAKDSRRDN